LLDHTLQIVVMMDGRAKTKTCARFSCSNADTFPHFTLPVLQQRLHVHSLFCSSLSRQAQRRSVYPPTQEKIFVRLPVVSHFHESSARCGRWGSFMLLRLHPQHAKLWPIGTPTQWPSMHSDLLSTRAESRIALARHDHPGHPLWPTTAFFLLAKACRPPATKSLTWQPWRGSRGHNQTA
jgi:hypothetical protein